MKKISLITLMCILFSSNTMATNISSDNLNEEQKRLERRNFICTECIPSIEAMDSFVEDGELTPQGLEENSKHLNILIEKLEESQANVILFVCAPGGRSDQEIPEYVKTFVSRSGKSVDIFSVDLLYFLDEKQPESFQDPKMRLEKLFSTNYPSIPLWVGSYESITFMPFSACIPDEKMDGSEIFFENLAQIFKHKLNNGQKIIVGNHGSYRPGDMKTIYQLYHKQFDEDWSQKFTLYMQCGMGMTYLHNAKLPEILEYRLTDEMGPDFNFDVMPWPLPDDWLLNL